MSRTLYFSGETLLKSPFGMRNSDFAARFPSVNGRRADSFSMLVGYSADDSGGLRHVDRVVTYKSGASRHDCDARCVNATGRVMKCECACGGKNHGRGGR